MPVYRLHDTGAAFPPSEHAEGDGLLAVGGDLSPARLVAAYAAGIFPWYSEGQPILWWSPDPRCILAPAGIHVPRSLRKALRSGVFALTLDAAFEEVIRACAKPRKDGGGTWLVPDMVEAYIALHRLGLAHSAEAWHNGELAGGVYGVSLGGAFFGESMFHRVPNAGKAALVHLAQSLAASDFTLLDCQQETANLLRFGAACVPRAEFLERLERALEQPTRRGSWADGIPGLPV